MNFKFSREERVDLQMVFAIAIDREESIGRSSSWGSPYSRSSDSERQNQDLALRKIEKEVQRKVTMAN
jgi:hypothetical protein